MNSKTKMIVTILAFVSATVIGIGAVLLVSTDKFAPSNSSSTTTSTSSKAWSSDEKVEVTKGTEKLTTITVWDGKFLTKDTPHPASSDKKYQMLMDGGEDTLYIPFYIERTNASDKKSNISFSVGISSKNNATIYAACVSENAPNYNSEGKNVSSKVLIKESDLDPEGKITVIGYITLPKSQFYTVTDYIMTATVANYNFVVLNKDGRYMADFDYQ